MSAPTRRLALSIMVIVAVLSIVYSLALNLFAMVIGLVYLVLGVCILMLFSACFGSMRRSYLDLPFSFFWHVCRGSLSLSGRIDRKKIEIYLFMTNHNLTGLGKWYASGLFFCINMRKERMPMAVTRRIPMHMNKGKNHFPESGRQNGLCEESGEDGQRWTGHDPMTVDKKFMLFKRQYEQTTDRRHRGMKWLLTRFVSPSSPARSHRRKRTDWGRNWLSVLQKVSMPSLWQLISIDPMFINTSYSIPLPLTEPESSKTFGYPVSPCRKLAIGKRLLRIVYP